MAFDPKRLKTKLLNTQLQSKDNPLYDLLSQIIDALGTLNITGGSGGGGGGTTIVNNITQIAGTSAPGLDGSDGEEGSLSAILNVAVPGPQGITGSQGPTGSPIFIEDGVDGNDGFNIPNPGPQGTTGAQGPIGPMMIPEDVIYNDEPNPFTEPQRFFQVKQTIETTTYTITAAFADVTALSVSITPTRVENRIRVQCSIMLYLGNGLSTVSFKILRGATLVQQYDSIFNNNTNQYGTTVYLDVIDSPVSVSSLTYKVQAKLTNVGAALVNNPINGGELPASSITVTELPV